MVATSGHYGSIIVMSYFGINKAVSQLYAVSLDLKVRITLDL